MSIPALARATLALAAFAVLASGALPVAAQKLDRTCVISDPTGTPLNVRADPNGKVVGTIANGVWVAVRTRTTVAGKSWAYVHDSDMHGTLGPPLGWVFDAYLKCL